MRRQRIQWIAELNPETLDDATDPDRTFRYIDIGSVSAGGRIEPGDHIRFGDAPSRARRIIRADDIVVSTVRTYLRAVARIPPDLDGQVASTGFAVLRPRPNVDARFLAYSCASDPFVEEVVARSVGVSYPAINASDLAKIEIALPGIEEQRRIANFLDRETARIDELAAAKDAMLTCLESRLRRVCTDLLADQPLGPRLKHVSAGITSGPRGWGHLVADEGTPFIRIANVDRRTVFPIERNLIAVDAPQSPERVRATVREGDALISITADIGSTAIVQGALVGGVVSQHVALVRRDAAKTVEGWAAMAVRDDRAAHQLIAGQYGGTKQQLSLGEVADVRICAPAMDVQREIASRVRSKSSALIAAHDGVATSIAILAEYRRALITEAVTGQLDIARMSESAAEERLEEALS